MKVTGKSFLLTYVIIQVVCFRLRREHDGLDIYFLSVGMTKAGFGV